jgi:hypothetical protein
VIVSRRKSAKPNLVAGHLILRLRCGGLRSANCVLRTPYESTPKSDSGLRDIVIEIINQHRDLMKDSEIKNMLEELNGLTVSLLKVVCSSNPPVGLWGRSARQRM